MARWRNGKKKKKLAAEAAKTRRKNGTDEAR
jgi:hypothetical protein